MNTTLTVPAWVDVVLVHVNAIDGRAPVGIAGTYSVASYQARRKRICETPGAGEWDVIVYGLRYKTTDKPKAPRTYHPYGRDNPYTRLCSNSTCELVRLEQWNYCSPS